MIFYTPTHGARVHVINALLLYIVSKFKKIKFYKFKFKCTLTDTKDDSLL